MRYKFLHAIGILFIKIAEGLVLIANKFLTASTEYRTDIMHKQIIGWKEVAFVVQRKYRQHIHIKEIK